MEQIGDFLAQIAVHLGSPSKQIKSDLKNALMWSAVARNSDSWTAGDRRRKEKEIICQDLRSLSF